MDARTLFRVVPLLVAVLFFSAAPASANVIHVPGDQPSIQVGINAAGQGDTVLVACGTYYEHSIQMRSGITVHSATGVATCATINAQHQGCVMICEAADSTTVIEGFTLRGGRLPGCSSGGGLYCTDSSLRFRHCVFLDNEECLGGCMYCRGSSPAFSDCVFEGNHGEFDGGAVDCVSSEPFFIRCQFIANSAANRGGAVFCNQSSPVFIDCTFESNSATTGGALCSAVASTPTATRCTFTANSAFQLGGAAECHAQCSALFAECVFLLNTVNRDGAALAGIASWIEIDACTFYENAAGHDGAGVYLEEGGIALLDNTIIAGSTDGQAVYGDDAGCAATANCCDVFGNVDGDWVSCLAGQQGVNGNISEDPLFCDAPNGDLTLHADSPCAPENSPAGCGLIGALPVGCGVTAVALEGVSSPWIGLRVHPNPIRDSGVVECMSDGGMVALRLYDPKGRLVLARDMDGRGSGLRRVGWGDVVGGRSLASGIYFLEVGQSAGQRQATRVIVVR